MSWPLLALLLVIALLVVAIAIAIAVVARGRRVAPVVPPPLPRYPIVLVHGFLGFGEIRLFGRPFRYFRGVAEAMAETGATVHIVTLPAAASVEERARVLAEAVRALPAPRVHLVAHSMGGLDARYAIARLGLADRVASLVTIGTPHQGTPLARLGTMRPMMGLRRVVTRVGYRSDAIDWLTPERMARFNEECPDHPDVYYACVVGSSRWRISNPGLWSGHVLMGRAAGASDGVVPVASQRWGEVIAELDADHWAQIGWAVGFDVRPLYRDIALSLRARDAAPTVQDRAGIATRPAS
jgi:triacylglycerol lipase